MFEHSIKEKMNWFELKFIANLFISIVLLQPGVVIPIIPCLQSQ